MLRLILLPTQIPDDLISTPAPSDIADTTDPEPDVKK
jgi:hypothetical protein